ncbi:MAG: SdiA-regulated domain-containing protein [bacterium]|nr:SdiA-regulated domain-containing protein [Candidatus Kapabacteria bacterium]
MRKAILLISFSLAMVACQSRTDETEPASDGDIAKTINRIAPTLALYDLASKSPSSVKLPKEIHEISGLAMSASGKLFANGDERARVYEIDIVSGEIAKSFDVGDKPIRKDFEGIAIAHDTMYMITSDGDLYSFREGGDKESVTFEVVETGLKNYDIEGLCFDQPTNSLLIACKLMPDDKYERTRAVYSYSIDRATLESAPRFLISEDTLAAFGGALFRPSSIERHPQSGSFLILASQGSAIIEVAADGRLLGRVELPKSVHYQPEGIAIAPDGSLLIGNEGASRGTLVRYPRHSAP